MRSLKELYQIVLNELKGKDKDTITGICNAINLLCLKCSITSEECNLLRDHFDTIPRPKKSFFNFDKVTPDSAWYWETYYKKPRIKFIKEIIKSL